MRLDLKQRLMAVAYLADELGSRQANLGVVSLEVVRKIAEVMGAPVKRMAYDSAAGGPRVIESVDARVPGCAATVYAQGSRSATAEEGASLGGPGAHRHDGHDWHSVDLPAGSEA